MLVRRRDSEQQETGKLEDRKFRLIGRGNEREMEWIVC